VSLIKKKSNILIYSISKSPIGTKDTPVTTDIVTGQRHVTMLPESKATTLRDNKINHNSDVRVIYLLPQDDLDSCDPATNKQLYATIDGSTYECLKLVRHTQRALIKTSAELYVLRRSN
jgi:hypothetical protein